MTLIRKALVLAPSRHLGGGIERYVDGVCDALDILGVRWTRLDYTTPRSRPTMARRIGFVGEAVRRARFFGSDTVLLVMHPALVPAALIVARIAGISRSAVIFHGTDIFNSTALTRRLIKGEQFSLPIAVSNYSARQLSVFAARPAVLQPGLTRNWYELLVGTNGRTSDRDIDVLTVFRLAVWREKGLQTIAEALERLPVRAQRTVVAGKGPVPGDLQAFAETHDIEVLADRSSTQLAELYARSKCFVLATREAGSASVEGFGFVLAEAQLSRTPVIAPAGGATDAYVEGRTGLRVLDESPDSLASELQALLADEARREKMAEEAHRWASIEFEPVRYARRVEEVLVKIVER